eukprot:2303407-Amphidinium_carterae.1
MWDELLDPGQEGKFRQWLTEKAYVPAVRNCMTATTLWGRRQHLFLSGSLDVQLKAMGSDVENNREVSFRPVVGSRGDACGQPYFSDVKPDSSAAS